MSSKYILGIVPHGRLGIVDKPYPAEKIKNYFNPGDFFKKVYCISQWESLERHEYGMYVIPTQRLETKNRIKDLNIDIVRAYGHEFSVKQLCENKVNNVPVVVSIHDTDPKLLNPTIISKSDIIFCTTDAVKNMILSKIKYNEKNMWILPNKFNFKIMKKQPKEEYEYLNEKYKFKYKILHIGRRVPEKNLDNIIKAMSYLSDDYGLIAIGNDGELFNFYRDIAKKFGIINKCHFEKRMNHLLLPLYYSWCDCLCNPSRSEGFGNVIIEGLACESVVITSDVPPMNKHIQHGYNGLLVKNNQNPKNIAESIELACIDISFREKVIKNARNSVRKFEKSIIVEKEINYYKKILKGIGK